MTKIKQTTAKATETQIMIVSQYFSVNIEKHRVHVMITNEHAVLCEVQTFDMHIMCKLERRLGGYNAQMVRQININMLI